MGSCVCVCACVCEERGKKEKGGRRSGKDESVDGREERGEKDKEEGVSLCMCMCMCMCVVCLCLCVCVCVEKSERSGG